MLLTIVDATEDKLRRLIELVASKIEGRLDDIENRLNTVDTSIGDVNKGANEIFSLQKTDMGLTEKVGSLCCTKLLITSKK